MKSLTLEEHPRFKGEEAGYRAKHYRLVSLFGKADHCENQDCQHQDYHRFEWANLNGDYDMDRSNWAMLCVYCHRQLDKQGIVPRLTNGL
ncbi:hnh endonuclease [Caudoviricetes sp.]|nr:hnh endonuclease [Caudoviricetes sp.]